MTEPPSAARPLTFSIVIPTYNEASGIGRTCEALLTLTPEPEEIIFVDGASMDDTRRIIRTYLLRPSMQLLEERSKNGVASARNIGARAASGEVIVFLNADVRLPPDFLLRVSRHYEWGADYVAVESEVINTDSVYGRFLQAQHQYSFGGDRPVGWTEGFSCRRALALQAGLFAEALPGAGGEDGEFVERLSALTNRGVVDKTIVVPHVTPDTMVDFWHQWQGRGVAVPFLRHRVHHVSWPILVAERIAAGLWSLLLAVLAVPVLSRAVALSRQSDRRWSDLPPFVALSLLQPLAHRVGEWKGMLRLYRAETTDAR